MNMFIDIFPTSVYVANQVLSDRQQHTLQQLVLGDSLSTPQEWACTVQSSFGSSTNVALADCCKELFAAHMDQYRQNVFKRTHSNKVQAWSNHYTDEQSFQEQHDHLQHGSGFCGVYILEQHADDVSGLTFHDPLAGIKSLTGHDQSPLTPPLVQNDLVLFPSYLEHSVRRTTLQHPRVTVSFNVL